MEPLIFKSITNNFGTFWVTSHKDKRKSYACSLSSCACGEYKYHKINPCKHMEDLVKEIRRVYGTIGNFTKIGDEGFGQYIQLIGDGIDAMEFINKLGGINGDLIINKLKSIGVIYERMGRLHILK